METIMESNEEYKSATEYLFLSNNDRCELIISGYNREIELSNNVSIPTDIYNLIYQYYIFRIIKLIFCDENGDIDETKYISRAVPEDIKLIQLSTTLCIELCNKENNQIPDIHLWMKFKDMKSIFPINRGKALVTEDDLFVHPAKWMEIPHDYLMMRQLSYFSESCFAVEIKQPCMKAWPRAKFVDGIEWNKIETGDFVDCKDDQDKWYETWVRCVNPKIDPNNCGFSNFIVVHYVGWSRKWDHALKIPQFEMWDRQFAVRNTYTKGPCVSVRHLKDREYYLNVICIVNEFEDYQLNVIIKRIQVTISPFKGTLNVKGGKHTVESFKQSLQRNFFNIVNVADRIKLKCVTGFIPNTNEVETIRNILPYYLGDMELVQPLKQEK